MGSLADEYTADEHCEVRSRFSGTWLKFELNWIEFRLLKNTKHINYNKFECSFSKDSEGACL